MSAIGFQYRKLIQEVNAVNSEHEKNLNNQFRRMWEMMRTQATPDNPLHHFFTGNTTTLCGNKHKCDTTQSSFFDVYALASAG